MGALNFKKLRFSFCRLLTSFDNALNKNIRSGITPISFKYGFLVKEKHRVITQPQITKKRFNWSRPYLPIKKRLILSNIKITFLLL